MCQHVNSNVDLSLWCLIILLKSSPEDMFIDFRERGRERKADRKRETDRERKRETQREKHRHGREMTVSFPATWMGQLLNEPKSQVCALTGNQTLNTFAVQNVAPINWANPPGHDALFLSQLCLFSKFNILTSKLFIDGQEPQCGNCRRGGFGWRYKIVWGNKWWCKQ